MASLYLLSQPDDAIGANSPHGRVVESTSIHCFVTEVIHIMNKLPLLASLTVLAAALAAPAAQAADNGFYLGAGVTKSKVDGLEDQLDFDDESFKLIAGFRPLDSFGVEVNYIDLGKDSTTIGPITVSADAKAVAAYAVGYLPLTPIDLYLKAGLARWESSASATGLGSFSDDGTEFAYGAGIQARFGSLAARLEYESFDAGGSDRAELLSVGVTWTFL